MTGRYKIIDSTIISNGLIQTQNTPASSTTTLQLSEIGFVAGFTAGLSNRGFAPTFFASSLILFLSR